MMRSLDRILGDIFDDPRRAAVLGALGGAAKGAVLGLAFGKLAAGAAVGAVAGAGAALLLRAAVPRLTAARAVR